MDDVGGDVDRDIVRRSGQRACAPVQWIVPVRDHLRRPSTRPPRAASLAPSTQFWAGKTLTGDDGHSLSARTSDVALPTSRAVRNGVPIKTILGDVRQTGQSKIKYNKKENRPGETPRHNKGDPCRQILSLYRLKCPLLSMSTERATRTKRNGTAPASSLFAIITTCPTESKRPTQALIFLLWSSRVANPAGWFDYSGHGCRALDVVGWWASLGPTAPPR